MAKRRLARLTLLMAMLGVAIALVWVWLSGGAVLVGEISRVRPLWLVSLVLATAVNVCVRFLRWHYLLRRVQVLLPARRSFSIYLASLAAIITPAYLGEVVRPVFVRNSFSVPIRTTLPVLIAERMLDIAALSIIGLFTASNLFGVVAMGAVLVSVLLVAWLARTSANALSPGLPAIPLLTRGRVLFQATLLSMAAWIPAAATVTLASSTVGESISIPSGMSVFASSTLFGGFSLMPAGVGVTGSVVILRLQDLGLELTSAVAVASLVRFSTVGITLAIGGAFLALELSRVRHQPAPDSVPHFDAIADEYEQQFPQHIWEFLVEKKTSLIAAAVQDTPAAKIGLDLGCGHGHHCVALERRGFRVVGMDPAEESVSRALRAGANVLCGSGAQLPYRDESFDFIYSIGVLHHLDRDTDRSLAYGEIHRVLRPGGIFLLHETNPSNLLFRFYMGYVFPILKSIDEGTEQWIHPQQLHIEGMYLDSVKYSTFLPDFTPAPLMKPLTALDRRLEASRWKKYAAHYFATFTKTQ